MLRILRFPAVGVLGLFALLSLSACDRGNIDEASAPKAGIVVAEPTLYLAATGAASCPSSSAPTGPGSQHLALLIGVNDYQGVGVPKLRGSVNDVNLMRQVLTDPKGAYRVPPENVCVLTDSSASLRNLLSTYKRFLLDRVDSEDQVTIYFAGHGGQVTDADGIEADGRDETLLLSDTLVLARISPQTGALYRPHLTDDLFGLMLDSLNRKLTASSPGRHALTVIVDACNSLSATRGQSRTARFHDDQSGVSFVPHAEVLREVGLTALAAELESLGSEREMSTLAPDGAVILAAAGDGTVAWESDRNGIFTTALASILAQAQEPMSYRQLEWRVRYAMVGEPQVPAFHGRLDSRLFGSDIIGSGAPHIVSGVEADRVTLSGIPVPGFGPGAEFRIYSGATAEGFNDVTQSKATLEVLNTDPVRVEARIIQQAAGSRIMPGDKAVLVSVSPSARKLKIALAETLPEDAADRIRRAIAASADAERGISLVEKLDDPEFVVLSMPSSAGQSERFGIVDARGKVRFTLTASGAPNARTALDIVDRLEGFARQKSLLALQGEGGTLLKDGETISVSLVPYEGPGPTSCDPAFKPSGQPSDEGNNVWTVPICARYHFKVEATNLDREVQIGILYLSSDGNIYSVPSRSSRSDQEAQRYRLTPPMDGGAGDVTKIFYQDPYQSTPPLSADDHVLVFAVDAKTPVPWWRLAKSQTERSASSSTSGLYKELDRYLGGKTRTGGPAGGEASGSPWSVSKLTLKTSANPGFAETTDAMIGTAAAKREYTISGFRIDPYLPSDTQSALYRVLQSADLLAASSASFSVASAEEEVTDGYPYKQHDWCAADADGNIDYPANLEIGIDCSRSVWYAFTQAGLGYSRAVSPGEARKACLPYGAAGNDYLTTKDMARPDSPMAEYFEPCLGQDLKIGDLLVYRRDTDTDGHTVMVIDPEERIAWGSHGWDGNPRLGLPADSGVEYQKIKFKKDWERWDSANMQLKACWRHKAFIDERADPLFELNGNDWSKILCKTPGGCRIAP